MIKLLIGIFALSIFCASCSVKGDDYLTVYFDNGIIDDGPNAFPDFLAIERKYPETIYQLEDLRFGRDAFIELEAIINRRVEEGKVGKEVNNNAKIETVYLLLDKNRIKIFFNSFNEFYNTDNRLIFKNDSLANNIRRFIKYKETLATGVPPNMPPPVYFKILIRSDI